MREEQGWDIRDFKKVFPALYKEMMSRRASTRIEAVRLNQEEAEREASKTLNGFMPGPIDYLRRCRDEEEAIKVLEYLEKRGEITSDYCEELRQQVLSLGVRSFGALKEQGYYLKRYATR